MNGFVSEDEFLRSFEDWLRYQQVNPDTLTANQRELWRRQYEEVYAKAAEQAKIGLMKLGPLLPGERRYAVAVRDWWLLWLTPLGSCSR